MYWHSIGTALALHWHSILGLFCLYTRSLSITDAGIFLAAEQKTFRKRERDASRSVARSKGETAICLFFFYEAPVVQLLPAGGLLHHTQATRTHTHRHTHRRTHRRTRTHTYCSHTHTHTHAHAHTHTHTHTGASTQTHTHTRRTQ